MSNYNFRQRTMQIETQFATKGGRDCTGEGELPFSRTLIPLRGTADRQSEYFMGNGVRNLLHVLIETAQEIELANNRRWMESLQAGCQLDEAHFSGYFCPTKYLLPIPHPKGGRKLCRDFPRSAQGENPTKAQGVRRKGRGNPRQMHGSPSPSYFVLQPRPQ